jgi:hypothetical protein
MDGMRMWEYRSIYSLIYIFSNLQCLLEAFGSDNESGNVGVILSIGYQSLATHTQQQRRQQPKLQRVSAFHVV